MAVQLLPGNVVADGELLGVSLRLLEREGRDEAFLRQRLIGLCLKPCSAVLGGYAGGGGLLLKVVVAQLEAQISQRRFGSCEPEHGILELQLELRVAQLQNDGVSRDRRAGADDD